MGVFPGRVSLYLLMRKSVSFLICSLSFLIAVTCAYGQQPRASAAGSAARVGIFFDGPANTTGKAYLHALYLENLLGHFDLRGEITPIAQYRPGQVAGYQAAFFIGAAPTTELPPRFLTEVRSYSRPFCWMGQHIGKLVNAPESRGKFGFRFQEYADNLGFNQVFYKDTLLPKEEPDLNVVNVTDPAAVEVVSTTVNPRKVWHPYALRHERFWYFADTPFSYMAEGGRYLVLCDLLHDILEVHHAADNRALVRIEDVSIEDDPADLRELADNLGGHRIPFQIALIPVFRNPAQGREVRMSDRRSFVDAIKYMVSRGGTPIMHGVTHQYHGQSADDYEFWDDATDRPVVGDSAEFVMRKLQLGLTECFGSGIFPIAWETPHYAASELDYRTFKRVFRLFYDRTMSAPRGESQQFFPYPLTDRYGRQIVPEDLGYLTVDKPNPADVIEHARNLRVVRDGVASFYFHPFLDASLLDQLVRGVSGLGYRFVSLREFGGEVDYQGRFIVRTTSGSAKLAPQNEYWRMRLFDANGRLTGTELSKSRQNGPVEVAVEVPKGGFAALDCIREIPAVARQPDWTARLKQWWDHLFPEPGDKEGVAAQATFATGKTAWILSIDKGPAGDLNNERSYRAVLQTFGYQTKLVNVAQFRSGPPPTDTILVVPQAAGVRLSESQQKEVLRYLSEGGGIVADGRQPWLEKLGFAWSDRQAWIGAVADVLYPEMGLRWQPEENVTRFSVPDGVRQLMTDHESDQVLASAGSRGAGHFIHLAIPLDNHTPDGVSHYPYFSKYLSETFGMATALRKPRVEAYFDPGFRPGADLNRLAANWQRAGIRTIYAAAWTFSRTYSYNYADLITACHRQGISVYAWLVLPQVTQKMWDEHPEWREKTATGADGRVGWRYLLNFQNPACFRASMDWTKWLLNAYEWDGVNIAELNFDADFVDYLKADKFVPFNQEVRAAFQKKAGFDPVQLFSPASAHYYKNNPGALQKFLRYREDIVTDWHRRVLEELEPMRRSKGWEVIVTMLDSLHSRYVRPALGIDSRRIVDLMKQHEFTLQVEDPAEYWNKPPDRYRRFAQTYLKLVRDPKRLMFDVNVMSDRDVAGTTLPSPVATGIELARTMAAASAASGRVAVYSEHTVPLQDWSMIRVALTRPAQIQVSNNVWRVDSPVPMLLAPTEDRDYYVDGRLWPAVSQAGLLVPAGKHTISVNKPWFHFLDPGTLPARLVSTSGDLIQSRANTTGLDLEYVSPGRNVLVFNQKPRETYVDGKLVDVVLEPSGSNWAAVFPAGHHSVAVVTNTKAGIAVNVWGWLSASAIAAFGALSTAMMLAIYLQVRLRRLGRRRGTL
jgi:uncharacterized protein YdaL